MREVSRSLFVPLHPNFVSDFVTCETCMQIAYLRRWEEPGTSRVLSAAQLLKPGKQCRCRCAPLDTMIDDLLALVSGPIVSLSRAIKMQTGSCICRGVALMSWCLSRGPDTFVHTRVEQCELKTAHSRTPLRPSRSQTLVRFYQ